MKHLIIILLILNINCNMKNIPPKTVDYVDLDKYSGLWYEIARYPNSFEKNCENVTAEYLPTEKNYIKVINSCLREGEERQAVGKAFIKDKTTNAKLKVQFFWPFRGDYWIIMLDEKDYKYAVVSDKNKKYLWILFRESKMPEETLNEIKLFLQNENFDLKKLIYTPQNQ